MIDSDEWDSLEEHVKEAIAERIMEQICGPVEGALETMGMSDVGKLQFWRWFGVEMKRRADYMEPDMVAEAYKKKLYGGIN